MLTPEDRALAGEVTGPPGPRQRRAIAKAVTLLESASVPLAADEVVPVLLNRDRTGPCLMEQKASATEDPGRFLEEIVAFFS